MRQRVTAQMNMASGGQRGGDRGRGGGQRLSQGQHVGAVNSLSWRTYIPEPKRRHGQPLDGQTGGAARGLPENRRRVRGQRSKKLQRLRSEHVERSFAHVCETGGGRRSWLHGVAKISKRYLMQVAAHNLGIVMRRLFGVGTPRSLQGLQAAFLALVGMCHSAWRRFTHLPCLPYLMGSYSTHAWRTSLTPA